MSNQPGQSGAATAGFRVAELLAPLSLVTDLGMGAPDEEAMRTCLLATALGRRMNLPEATVAEVYYSTLLRHLGCTATAHDEAARLGGDELATRPLIGPADFGRPREVMSVLSRAGSGRGLVPRARIVTGLATGNRWAVGVQTALCEVASMLAAGVGMPPPVETALGQMFERWDGKGEPGKLSGEDIVPGARFAQVAARAIAFHDAGGVTAAVEGVRVSAGGWLDPEISSVVVENAADLFAELEAEDPLVAVLAAEPEPRMVSRGSQLDETLEAFADMVDLKSAFTIGHSRGVATLAASAASAVGSSRAEATDLKRAALVHDLGRVGVPSGIWDKPGALSAAERERMQMHPYYSERILLRVPALAPLATAVGMHHERLDGSGYHRGAGAREIPMLARLLAASDCYATMIERRPHRDALEPQEACERLLADAEQGRLDIDAARAVVGAAGGLARPVVRAFPAGLSEREVEVLRLVARGHSNQEVADALVISRRTAEHHVQHIYDKIGVSTRAAATMFAMRNDLVDSPHAL